MPYLPNQLLTERHLKEKRQNTPLVGPISCFLLKAPIVMLEKQDSNNKIAKKFIEVFIIQRTTQFNS